MNPLQNASAVILQILPDRVVFRVNIGNIPELQNEAYLKACLASFQMVYDNCHLIEYKRDGDDIIVVAYGNVNLH